MYKAFTSFLKIGGLYLANLYWTKTPGIKAKNGRYALKYTDGIAY